MHLLKGLLAALSVLLFSKQIYAASVNLGLRIKFDTGMSTINYKRDFKTVDELRKIQIDYPDSSMAVIGHTDSTGTDEVNQVLSEARAATVVKAFQARGGAVDKVMGYGEHAPVATNRTKKGRAENRRVVSTVFGLTNQESLKLVKFVESSDRLFVISVENEKIESLVEEMEKEKKEEQEQDLEQVEILEEPQQSTIFREESESDNIPTELAEISSFWDRNRYAFQVRSSYSFLKAEDITGPGLGVDADWVSELNYGFALAYQHNFQKNYWIGLQGGIDIQDYIDLNSAGYTWDQGSPSLVNLAVEFDYEKNRLGLGVNLQASQQTLVTENATVISLRNDWVYSVIGEVNYLIFERGQVKSRLGIDLILPLASSGVLDVDGSPGGFNFRYDASKEILGSHEVMFGVFYSFLKFEHNQGEQNSQTAGAQISLRSSRWF